MASNLLQNDGTVKPALDDDSGRRLIIIYSPDLNFCFSLSMLFQDRYNVMTTTSLSMLEDMVIQHTTDLLILDAVPSAKIIERLDRLKEASVPIIMLYVYSPKGTPFEPAIRCRVDAVFYKPFDIADVARRVDELLESSHSC